MEITARKPHAERCREEMTRDVIFLLRSRLSKKSQFWNVESVWLSREEAESFAKSHEYRYPHGWQVYGICSEGELAELIRKT